VVGEEETTEEAMLLTTRTRVDYGKSWKAEIKMKMKIKKNNGSDHHQG
jgi:hypothetical protein